jgi:hypothetical protein
MFTRKNNYLFKMLLNWKYDFIVILFGNYNYSTCIAEFTPVLFYSLTGITALRNNLWQIMARQIYWKNSVSRILMKNGNVDGMTWGDKYFYDYVGKNLVVSVSLRNHNLL